MTGQELFFRAGFPSHCVLICKFSAKLGSWSWSPAFLPHHTDGRDFKTQGASLVWYVKVWNCLDKFILGKENNPGIPGTENNPARQSQVRKCLQVFSYNSYKAGMDLKINSLKQESLPAYVFPDQKPKKATAESSQAQQAVLPPEPTATSAGQATQQANASLAEVLEGKPQHDQSASVINSTVNDILKAESGRASEIEAIGAKIETPPGSPIHSLLHSQPPTGHLEADIKTDLSSTSANGVREPTSVNGQVNTEKRKRESPRASDAQWPKSAFKATSSSTPANILKSPDAPIYQNGGSSIKTISSSRQASPPIAASNDFAALAQIQTRQNSSNARASPNSENVRSSPNGQSTAYNGNSTANKRKRESPRASDTPRPKSASKSSPFSSPASAKSRDLHTRASSGNLSDGEAAAMQPPTEFPPGLQKDIEFPPGLKASVEGDTKMNGKVSKQS